MSLPRAAQGVSGAPPAPPIFAPDAVLDDSYQIVRPLAQGGIGEVYLATQRRLGRNVAVKVLTPEYACQEEWMARFKREALILGQLRHPNIVQVLDFNVAVDGSPFLAMELIEGPDLRAALRAGRRFSPGEIISIVTQVASALSAAHALGVVHRDLKAENVVLCEAPGQPPVVKVIDFGISLWGAADQVTAEHTVFGTPEYMAPEQAQGIRDQIDARTDQFSLAVLAYLLLTNRPPFAGETPLAILFQIVHGQPAALGPRDGWDGARAEEVIRRGMAVSRDDRYPSVLAFAEALERAIGEGGGLEAPAPRGPDLAASGEDHVTRSLPTIKTRRSRSLPRVLAAVVIALGVSLSMASPEGHRTVDRGVSAIRHTARSVWAGLASRVNASLEGLAPP